MLDYAAWTQRASAFIRGLSTLPGNLELDDGIELPATDDYDRDWLESNRCTLPPELKSFVSTASRHCFFRYRWKIPGNLIPLTAELFPGSEELTGGGDFCNSAGFSYYDGRDSFRDNVLPQLEEAISSLSSYVKVSASEVLAFMDEDRARGRIALMPLRDGMTLSLDLAFPGGRRPIVLAKPTSPAIELVIADNFDEFLVLWEELSYIAPSPKNLAPWLDPLRRRVDSNKYKRNTALFRTILTTSLAETA